MRSIVILMSVVVLATGQNSTTNSTTDNSSGNDTSTASTRLPRGTVYQIRPINFEEASDSNPFSALDSIPGIDFAKLRSRNEEQSEERGDNSYSPSSSNVRVINFNPRDSEAVEAVDMPKFILAASSNPGRKEFSDEQEPEIFKSNANREPTALPSQPIPIQNEDGTEEPWDASYAFGYTLEDQARHEVSDPDGNIKGYYQYVDDEGFVRKVVYTAGAGKGFVVLNKEKVKGPRPHHPSSPPKKTGHKITNNIVPSGYDPRPSSRPSRPRPRPNYPQSPHLEPVEFDYPQSPSPPPRQGWSSSSGKENANRRPIYVVKIRKPQHKHGEDEGGHGSFHKEDSSEDNGQWDGDVGNGPVYKYRGGKGQTGLARPDGAYTFGYETETANRLEKSDNYGNVRGSYSYVDNEGVKRTVHYIAGATTGFQVLGSSPSASRAVRIEAPPGFVVTRRNAPNSASTTASKLAPTLATAGSEYPGFPPNVIVYHIQADANSLNLSPWWDAFGFSKRPRKMRRIMRVHRKKPRNFPKNEDNEEEHLEKETQIQQGPLDRDIQIENDRDDTSVKNLERERPTDNLDNSVPLSDGLSPSVETSSPQPSPRFLIRATSDDRLDRPRPFRHSTKVNLDNFDMKNYFVRARRPSHRAYTKNFYSPDSDSSAEERESINNDPILLGPSHDALRARRRLQIPNPILLQPSSSRISVRSRGSRLDAAESNVYQVRSTPAGEEVQVPPTPNPVELFAAGNLDAGEASPREVSTSKSMQLSISSSTTRIPVAAFSSVPESDPVRNIVNLTSPSDSSFTAITTTSTTPEPTTTPTVISTPNPNDNTLVLTQKEFDHTGIMSSSTRLMQRLGVQHPHGGNSN